ncbi:MAG: hypothetical protein EPO07_13220 [Verrucomicrobia bacterium]|nr:MAG: hypothetical protein EPO07_13220 [Verrucomicrobiota bacterium]
MTNASSVIKSLIIYTVCIPLAVFLGYLLTNPLDWGTFITFMLIGVVLAMPFILRFHYPIMMFFFNLGAVAFFLPGRPQTWLVGIAISYAISLTHRILNKNVQPIRVGEISRPLIALLIVVLVTAQMTGGIGFRVFGSSTFGGKRYFFMLVSILGYYAMVAQRIPVHKAALYTGLFFLGGVTCVIGDLFSVIDPSFRYIFLFFPVYSLSGAPLELGVTRLSGVSAACGAVFSFMLARYGIRGIFLGGKPLRLLLFVGITGFGLFGGFRSYLMNCVMVFGLLFFMEGLHRTKLFPSFALLAALGLALTVPFLSSFPMNIQRSLAFLPVPIDPMARKSAEMSSEWRLEIWKAVLPQVPQHLLLGKGLAMSASDYGATTMEESRASADQWVAALSGDYHNGPLSVVMTFGIWGVLVFFWLVIASLKVLHNNYRYGDPALRTYNALFLASYITKVFMFLFVVGSFYSEVTQFAGWLGFCIALNGGVARPVRTPLATAKPEKEYVTVLPSTRPALSRGT